MYDKRSREASSCRDAGDCFYLEEMEHRNPLSYPRTGDAEVHTRSIEKAGDKHSVTKGFREYADFA
jgi:hypothetical protein